MKQKKRNAPVSKREGSKREAVDRSELESSEASPISIVRERQSSVPDPEVLEKSRRRRFSAQYKLRILKKTDACEPGEVGALLRTVVPGFQRPGVEESSFSLVRT